MSSRAVTLLHDMRILCRHVHDDRSEDAEKDMHRQRDVAVNAALLMHAEAHWDEFGIRLRSVAFTEAVHRAAVLVTLPPPLNDYGHLKDAHLTRRFCTEMSKP